PTTGGPYEFRLFLNGGYTRAATSSQISVVPAAPVITSLNPNTAMAGAAALRMKSLLLNFPPTTVGGGKREARQTTHRRARQLCAEITAADLAVAGSPQVTVVTPAPGGGTSNAVTFTVTSGPTLTVNTLTVAKGGSLTVTLTGGFGGPYDWLAFVASGAPDGHHLQWTYVGAGVTTTTWTITAPDTAGTYQFRLHLNDGVTRAATSPTVTVY